MFKLAVSLVLLFTFNLGNAAAGIWLLEIKYTQNGKSQKAFVVNAQTTEDYSNYIGNDSLFETAFRKNFGQTDSLAIYSQIIDHEKLAKAVSFPMHPFHLSEKHIRYIHLSQIKNISLKKIWVKNDYHIEVLSPLQYTDTLWLKKKGMIEYPIGDEVGCRLEVHKFSAKETYKAELKQFCDLYLRKEKLIDSEKKQYKRLLKKLKTKKIIVVELCGC
ncbi:MAG: hypothetical protein IPM51_17445 [Sphingobacteriaceae bacterium]|nr:hypothetical protein [Sphingobacteriaceae bacterium]